MWYIFLLASDNEGLTCREPRGFGFVQYLDPSDAEEAQYHMNRQLLYGRELTVIFAEENRKKPADMRNKERQRYLLFIILTFFFTMFLSDYCGLHNGNCIFLCTPNC